MLLKTVQNLRGRTRFEHMNVRWLGGGKLKKSSVKVERKSSVPRSCRSDGVPNERVSRTRSPRSVVVECLGIATEGVATDLKAMGA